MKITFKEKGEIITFTIPHRKDKITKQEFWEYFKHAKEELETPKLKKKGKPKK